MTTFNGPLRVGDKAQDAVGHVRLSQTAFVTFANTTAKVLFRIPKPYRISDIFIDVTTAFNSSGTDLLDIGKLGNANFYSDDVDISSTGRKSGVQTAKLANLVDTTDDNSVEVITATFAQSVADASAGYAVVTIEYSSIKQLSD